MVLELYLVVKFVTCHHAYFVLNTQLYPGLLWTLPLDEGKH